MVPHGLSLKIYSCVWMTIDGWIPAIHSLSNILSVVEIIFCCCRIIWKLSSKTRSYNWIETGQQTWKRKSFVTAGKTWPVTRDLFLQLQMNLCYNPLINPGTWNLWTYSRNSLEMRKQKWLKESEDTRAAAHKIESKRSNETAATSRRRQLWSQQIIAVSAFIFF